MKEQYLRCNVIARSTSSCSIVTSTSTFLTNWLGNGALVTVCEQRQKETNEPLAAVPMADRDSR